MKGMTNPARIFELYVQEEVSAGQEEKNCEQNPKHAKIGHIFGGVWTSKAIKNFGK